jgi:glutathione S-transferase
MFTLADICLVPTFVRMEDLGFKHLFEGRPNANRWYAAMKERPSFERAYFSGSRSL